jgi:hypothetical protein
MTLTFRNATYYDTKDLGVNNVKIRGHSSNSALNSWYVLLDDKGYFRTYQYDNMTFTY